MRMIRSGLESVIFLVDEESSMLFHHMLILLH
jgi:hypothetical protein